MMHSLFDHSLSSVLRQLESLSNPTPAQQSMRIMLLWLKGMNASVHADFHKQTFTYVLRGDQTGVQRRGTFSDHNLFSLEMTWDAVCDTDMMPFVRMLLHNINLDLGCGRFAMDHFTGQCSYHTSHFFGQTPMDSECCMHTIVLSENLINHYQDTLLPLFGMRRPDMDDACDEYRQTAQDHPDLIQPLLRAARG